MKPATGAQLWSLRNVLREEPEATFEKLAKAGYTVAEPAGFNISDLTIQGFKPEELKSLANDQGLQMVSAHFQFSTEDALTACDCAASIGIKYIIRSFFSNEIEQNSEAYKRAAEALNQMGATAKSFGLQLAYHNHAHEFELVNGVLLFDILLAHTDPELVVFQPDLGWLGYAGHDPVQLFEKYPGRFPLWHLRDIDAETRKTTAVGRGTIDFKSAIANRELAGLEYAIVEMASDVVDPLGEILSSHKIIECWF
ncbi:sugar phosphate isomerase/epimerase [Niabella yanshanensis]|uniref:Sugar phosphate isomerase/epimerase n=1 Tax=Niabella yanshanensis TaxID=577386 RepID=A0ABZ0WBT2_9BACT|nr:sugar phosphate isomerase/epimerase [Niabella yanshanensis]WQD40449.1 sugar phosphate isomerase/epimerase [Niabella yanshanensis]